MEAHGSPPRPVHARLLACLWLLSAAVIALPGWLLYVLSEGDGGRLAGAGLSIVAALALLTGAYVWVAGGRARPVSLGMSALIALAGAAAVAGLSADGYVFGRDALLVGGVPAAAAAVTAATAFVTCRRPAPA